MNGLESMLIPGRECGECTVCCVTPRIEEFQKPENVACKELKAGGGCGIYTSRPDVCRDWYCMWRIMPQLDDSWRPDKCRILLRLGEHGELVFLPLGWPLEVLTTYQALQVIASLIMANIPVSIAVPGKVGHYSAKLDLNRSMSGVLESGSFLEVQGAMSELVSYAMQHPTEPVKGVGKG